MARLKPRRAPVPAVGYDGARTLGMRQVEDPFEPGRMLTVPANSRHDVLKRMLLRNEIDRGQFEAAERLRLAFEVVSSCGVRAVDTSRDVVDGGRKASGLPERAMRAAKVLREAQGLLGWQGFRLVAAVACHGITGSAIAEQTSATVDRKAIQFQVRNGLEQLAILWGLVSDPRHVRKQASMVGMLTDRPAWGHDERNVAIKYA